MTRLHKAAFSLMYKYLQSLQMNHAVNIGPTLDQLNRLESIVIDGVKPEQEHFWTVLLHDPYDSEPVSVVQIERRPFIELDTRDPDYIDQQLIALQQVEKDLRLAGVWHDEMWLDIIPTPVVD